MLQRPCRHGVYHKAADGVGCGADLLANSTGLSVSAYDELTLTVANAALQDDGFYTRGTIGYGGEYELIAYHEGSTIRLNRPFQSLFDEIDTNGATNCLFAPGCPGTREVCNGRFNQLPDHGGYPWTEDFIGDGRTLF